MSAGHVGGIRGSGIVSSAADVLWMSVVCRMRGVGDVCEMCMCLARGGVSGEGGEWMRGLGLGFTNPVRTYRGSVGRVFGFRWGVGKGPGPGTWGWGGVMSGLSV